MVLVVVVVVVGGRVAEEEEAEAFHGGYGNDLFLLTSWYTFFPDPSTNRDHGTFTE